MGDTTQKKTRATPNRGMSPGAEPAASPVAPPVTSTAADSSDIKVISADQGQVDILQLTADERKLFFDAAQLEVRGLKIPQSFFSDMLTLTSQQVQDITALSIPEIDELLLRKVLQMSSIVPIIYEPPQTFLTIDRRYIKFISKAQKAAPPVAHINARVDKYMPAITATGIYTCVPRAAEVAVTGLVFFPRCWQPDHSHDIFCGRYTPSEAATYCRGEVPEMGTEVLVAGRKVKSDKFIFQELGEQRTRVLLLALATHSNLIYLYTRATSHAGIIDWLSTPRTTPQSRDLLALSTKPPGISSEPLQAGIAGAAAKAFEAAIGAPLLASTIASDLDSRGLLDTWYAMAAGNKSVVDTNLRTYTSSRARSQLVVQARAKLAAEAGKIGVFKVIAGKKLGVARNREILAQLKAKPHLGFTLDGYLSLYKPDERKLLVTEYDRQRKRIEAILGNKCPHVPLYRRYRRAADEKSSREFFEQLKTYFAKEDAGIINCNKCGFMIMCSHVRDLAEAEIHGGPPARNILAKYIGDYAIQGQYFCKICGELLKSMTVFDTGETGAPKKMTEELRNAIYGEIMLFVRQLKFTPEISINQFVSVVRDAIYGFIEQTETLIRKSRTNTPEEVKAKINLYTAVYVGAYIIYLANKRATDGVKIEFRGWKPKNASKALPEMIQHVVKLLMSAKNVNIREIRGMTEGILLGAVVDAFKAVTNVGGEVSASAVGNEDIYSAIAMDPVYWYIYRAYLASSHRAPKSMEDLSQRIPEIVGDVEGKITELYSRVREYKIGSDHLPDFPAPTKMRRNVAALLPKAAIATRELGYRLFMRRIRGRVWMEPYYSDAVEEPDTVTGEYGRPASKIFQDLMDDYEHIHAADVAVQQARTMLRHQGLAYVQRSSSVRPPLEMPLGRIYDEEGNRHRFTVLVVTTPGADPGAAPGAGQDAAVQEVALSDINKGLAAGATAGHLVDRKCADCSILFSAAGTLDNDKILTALDRRVNVYNFYRFYENRCPEGNLHIWANNTCKQCSLKQGPQPITPTDYYKKYLARYKQEREEFDAAGAADLVFTNTVVPLDVPNKDFSNWRFNFESVLELCNEISVNQHEIMCLAATERVQYQDIVSGAYIPPEVDKRAHTRIYALDSYVRGLIIEYNSLRYFHRLTQPSPALTRLIDESGINKHNIAHLHEEMPDADGGYDKNIRYFRINKKPRETVEFCIQELCELCLRILHDSNPTTSNLRRAFVKYYMQKILAANEMVTQYGHFNWSVIYGEKQKVDKTTEFDATGDEPDRYDDEETDTPDFGDTDAPMRNDSMDIDHGDEEDDEGIGGVRVEGYDID